MSNEMITSCKESSTKEELNGKPMKHGHPKNITLLFNGKNNPPLPSRTVKDRTGLRCSMFSKPLIGQGCTEKYYMVDIIPCNPTNEGVLGKQYGKY